MPPVNWKDTQDKFIGWWANKNQGAPLMKIVARRAAPIEPLEKETPFKQAAQAYLDVDELSLRYRNYLRTHAFYAQAFPNIDLNVGAGSMALYLGAEPEFRWDTVWFKECVPDGWENFAPFRFDAGNKWLCRHLEIIRRGVELANGQYLVTIPDIVENIDILSAMRGPQDMCYDLYDEPEAVHERLDALDELYFGYYDRFYNLVKLPDGSSAYTAFHIWGPGKTAKVQCDFCALMSPAQFREFIQGSLKKQCDRLDNAVYHLDGPDAVRHLDALLEIDSLKAIQWTHGAGNPDGLSERWYKPIYDKVNAAGKSLLLIVEDGGVEDWIRGVDALVDRYGTRGLYLLFPDMEQADAEKLLKAALRWR